MRTGCIDIAADEDGAAVARRQRSSLDARAEGGRAGADKGQRREARSSANRARQRHVAAAGANRQIFGAIYRAREQYCAVVCSRQSRGVAERRIAGICLPAARRDHAGIDERVARDGQSLKTRDVVECIACVTQHGIACDRQSKIAAAADGAACANLRACEIDIGSDVQRSIVDLRCRGSHICEERGRAGRLGRGGINCERTNLDGVGSAGQTSSVNAERA